MTETEALIERLRALEPLQRGPYSLATIAMTIAELQRLTASLAVVDPAAASFHERMVRAEAEVNALTASLAGETEDAERWRALMSSPKMHWMGSAGFDHHLREGAMPDSRALVDQDPIPRAGTSWHFGMEFWFGIEADPRFPDTFERRLMVAYVDAIRSRKEKQ